MSNSKSFVTGCTTFKITDYSFVKKRIVAGQHIRSNPFTVGGQQWVIEFYPNGFKSTHKDFVSIIVRLLNPNKPVKALFTIRLKDWSSSIEAWSTNTLVPTDLYTFSSTSSYSGHYEFMKHSNLEASTYLYSKDTLIIKTTLWVLN